MSLIKAPGESVKARLGGALSLSKNGTANAVAPVPPPIAQPLPEVPGKGGQSSDGRDSKAEEKVKALMESSQNNIDPANVSRKDITESSALERRGQTSILISKENLARMKIYKRKTGASVSGAVNAALTQLFDANNIKRFVVEEGTDADE